MAQLAAGGLARSPLRAVLTTFGVAIASGALTSMLAFALGLQRQAEAPFQKLGLLNNIEVFPRDEAPEGEPVPLDDAALDRIEALPHVSLAYPDFRMRGIHVRCGESHAAETIAISLPREVALVGFLDSVLTAGTFFSQGDAPEAVIGAELAKELGFAAPAAALGAELTVEASGLNLTAPDQFQYERQEFTVRVVGIYEFPGMGPQLLGGSLVLPVDVMKRVPGIEFGAALERLRGGGGGARDGYGRAMARVEHPRHLAETARAIREMGFGARTMLDELKEMRTFFLLMDLLLASVGTVALVVASLGIINTLVMAVLERYQEIGIYKAIGASDGDVRVLFLTEAAGVGLLGGGAGLLLARVVAAVIDVVARRYALTQGITLPGSLFAFPWWLLAGAVLFCLAVSLLAGVYPASRAARVDPICALRGL